MYWLRLLVSPVMFLLPLYMAAQQQGMVIQGSVTDQATGKPLPLVHVYLKNARSGVVTDINGWYLLRIPALPDRLIISCIGYLPVEKELNDTSSAVMNAGLVPKIEALSEVTIQSLKIEPVFKDEDWSVLDYELKGDIIYLLIFRNNLKHLELLLMNPKGDTLARQTDLPAGTTGLFKDCLDSIHLLTRDVVYQVCRESGDLILRYPDSWQKFNETFSQCITSLHGTIFVERYYWYGLGIEYAGINALTGERRKLAYVEDPFKLNLLKRNQEDIAALTDAPASDEFITSSFEYGIPDQEDYSVLRNGYAFKKFVRQAFYQPVNAPLVRIDDNLAVFDFPKSLIRFYDHDGQPIYEVPIRFHHRPSDLNIFKGIFDTREWDEYDICVDEARFKAYAIFRAGGTTDLREIDLFTGDLIRTIRLIYPFPEKLRINNGFAYFMYKPESEWTRKRLYRQRIF